jgi:hypothetical protein
MQTFYRIEHKETGAGMYHQGNNGTPNFYDILRETESNLFDDHHPSPYNDSKLLDSFEAKGVAADEVVYVGSKYSYGFCSVEQLRSWVYNDEWLRKLDESEYVLAVVESDDYFEGNTQGIFVKPEEYKKVSIKEFFNL